MQACQASCLAYRNTEVSPVSGWVLCQSFTYVVPTGACVAVVDPYGWFPHNASSRNGDGGGGAAASASASAGARAAVTTAGLVTWPPMSKCSSDADCSYNGKCGGGGGTHTSARNEAAKGVCSCDAAWAGDRCQTLQLLPTTPTAGLRATDDGYVRCTSTVEFYVLPARTSYELYDGRPCMYTRRCLYMYRQPLVRVLLLLLLLLSLLLLSLFWG